MIGAKPLLFRSILSNYGDFLIRRPMLSRTLTGTVIVAAGDLIAQTVFENKSLISSHNPVNLKRTFKLGCMSALVLQPQLYMWYSHIFPKIINSSTMSKFSTNSKNILSTIIDQTTFSAYYTGCFLYGAHFLQNYSFESAIYDSLNKLPGVMQVAWSFWPVVIMGNLMFIPLQYHHHAICFVGLFWNIYLCSRNKESIKKIEA